MSGEMMSKCRRISDSTTLCDHQYGEAEDELCLNSADELVGYGTPPGYDADDEVNELTYAYDEDGTILVREGLDHLSKLKFGNYREFAVSAT